MNWTWRLSTSMLERQLHTKVLLNYFSLGLDSMRTFHPLSPRARPKSSGKGEAIMVGSRLIRIQRFITRDLGNWRSVRCPRNSYSSQTEIDPIPGDNGRGRQGNRDKASTDMRKRAVQLSYFRLLRKRSSSYTSGSNCSAAEGSPCSMADSICVTAVMV